MENRFEVFFRDKNYLKVKNSLFNYLNRKTQIKKAFFQHNTFKNILGLDIGSGISPVSPIPKKTVFMDLSESGIKFLEKQGYNAEVGNITDLKLKKDSFNWIFCSEVLEHIYDYKKAIAEINKSLKPEGMVIITIPVHMRYWNIDDEFVEHYRRFNPKELKIDLIKSGFRILEEKPIGSKLERKITTLIVRLFKADKINKINSFRAKLIIFTNYILYFLIMPSIFFSSKNSTSIMMYVCKKV